MKKIVKEIKGQNIIQVTLPDERWYVLQTLDDNKNPIFRYMPSVTWIAGYYPKGIGFYKWLAERSWDESEAIKSAAGDKGSKVHAAIEMLLDGEEVTMDRKIMNPTTEQDEELSIEEWECICSFNKWFSKEKPKVIAKETVIISQKYNYAGTVDLICELSGEIYIVDFKTGQNIFTEHILQLSAYRHTYTRDRLYKLATLQLGYRRNKDGYKFTEHEDEFDMFLTAQKIWERENKDKNPKTIELPIKIKLEVQS